MKFDIQFKGSGKIKSEGDDFKQCVSSKKFSSGLYSDATPLTGAIS